MRKRLKEGFFLYVLGIGFALLIAVLCIPTCDDHFFRIWSFASWKDFLLLHPDNWGGYTFAVPHNGRYLGNILGFFLARSYNFPAGYGIRVLFLAGGPILLFMLVKRLFRASGRFSALILLLVILTPVNQYTQVLHWTAGFANYFVSALGVVLILNFLYVHAPKRWHFVLGMTGAFLTQLFAEHVTVYVLLLLSVYAIRSRKNSDKRKMAVGMLLAAFAGAAVMFLNNGYHMVNTDQYRTIGLESVMETMKTLAFDVVVGNGVLLSVGGIVFGTLLHRRRELCKRAISLGMYGILTGYALFRTFTVTTALERYRRLDVIAAVGIMLLLIYFTIMLITRFRWEALMCLGSICFINAMLLVLSPVSARCAYISYVLLLLYILIVAEESGLCALSGGRKMSIALTVAAFCYGSYLVFCYWQNAVVQNEWEVYCTQQYKARAEAIYVPELPYPHLVYDANSIVYYMYSIYYEEPNDIYFEMWDYSRWHSVK